PRQRLRAPNATAEEYVRLPASQLRQSWLVLWQISADQGDSLMPEYLEKSEFQAARAYSPAVITQGGRIAWLAGQTATPDEAGNDISGQFEPQVRTIFSLIDQTLKRCGGSLANLVTMTVFINDPRHGDRFVELRKSYFPDGNYPASALITVSHFARPGMLI